MTTRQYLIRRANATLGWTVIFLLAAGALLTSIHLEFVLSFVLATVVAVVALAAFWSLFEIPCPSCRKSLGSIGFRVANGRMQDSSPKCPHCGASLE